MQKINFLKKLKENSNISYGIETNFGIFEFDFSKNVAMDDQLSFVVKKYPFVPSDYLNFLRKNNGFSLNWIVFASISNDCDEFVSFYDLEKRFNNYSCFTNLDGCFPFAEDAEGNKFFFNKNKEVFLLDNSFPEKSYYLASSFEDFMENVLLGPRYKDLYPEDEDWWNFLKSLNWV